ncbi:MAG: zf-HC2 domain-containing protein [Bacteroidetes bacterium]|nr:zf-HC2 domain-containing protein [Bacteroidota bacterium]
MEHPERELLILFAEGLLGEAQADGIRSHIETCPRCRETVVSEREFGEALRTQPLLQPSHAFDRRVLDAVLPATSRSRREDISLRRYAGLIVLCVVTLIVAVIASGHSGNGPVWMRPVSDVMSTASKAVTGALVDGMKQLFSPLHAAKGSGVIEIFALAALALVVLGGLDRVFSPFAKKGR